MAETATTPKYLHVRNDEDQMGEIIDSAIEEYRHDLFPQERTRLGLIVLLITHWQVCLQAIVAHRRLMRQ